MNHLDLIAQFNERLESIEANRIRIHAILASTTDKAIIETCVESSEKLDVIEAELELAMLGIRSLN